MRCSRAAQGALSALLFTFLLASGARADVVHLKTGGTISGEVVAEDDDEVVLRTPDGRITLPRRMIERIDRQSAGQTRLSLARERDRAGAYAEAEALYRRVAEDSDPKLAAQARVELEELRRRRKRARGLRPVPRRPLKLPEGVTGEPSGGESLQDQLDRARWALEIGNGQLAARLLAPLAAANPDVAALRYLHGRGLELARRDEAARTEYAHLLGRRAELPPGREVAWLGELARRHVAGEALRDEEAGVGPAWRRTAGHTFVLYHRQERLEAWVERHAELALLHVLEALAVSPREVRFAGKVLVAVDGGLEPAPGGEELSCPFAGRLLAAPDGPLHLLRVAPDPASFMGPFLHQLAHAVLADTFPSLPGWALEGAAQRAAPQGERGELLAAARRRRALGELPPLEAFLAGELPAQRSPALGDASRGLAHALFAALVQQRGGARPALDLAHRIGERGPASALSAARVELAALEQALDAALGED